MPIEVVPNAHNADYLRTKREKMGHLLDAEEFDARAEPDRGG